MRGAGRRRRFRRPVRPPRRFRPPIGRCTRSTAPFRTPIGRDVRPQPVDRVRRAWPTRLAAVARGPTTSHHPPVPRRVGAVLRRAAPRGTARRRVRSARLRRRHGPKGARPVQNRAVAQRFEPPGRQKAARATARRGRLPRRIGPSRGRRADARAHSGEKRSRRTHATVDRRTKSIRRARAPAVRRSKSPPRGLDPSADGPWHGSSACATIAGNPSGPSNEYADPGVPVRSTCALARQYVDRPSRAEPGRGGGG